MTIYQLNIYTNKIIHNIRNKIDFCIKRIQIVFRLGPTVMHANTFVFVYIKYIQTMYPVESCNAGLRRHFCTCIQRHMEIGEEYFITIRQIMLNMLRFPCAHGGMRCYVNIYRIPTKRPTICCSIWYRGEIHLCVSIQVASRMKSYFSLEIL